MRADCRGSFKTQSVTQSAVAGGADVTGSSGDTTTGRTYEARCGADTKKCTVSFKDEKLIVKDGGAIYRDQFVIVVLKKECTQRSILLPWVTSCFQKQLDWEFTVTYDDNNSDRRSTLITFRPRHLATGATDRARKFERNLQVWIEDVLRPIGPSIVTDQPKPSPASRRPKQKAKAPECKAPLSDFNCNWGTYLEANPNMKAWADAKPSMAIKENIRLGAIDDGRILYYGGPGVKETHN